jgi:hypothetical protein
MLNPGIVAGMGLANHYLLQVCYGFHNISVAYGQGVEQDF